jgi:hypothetical protein
VCWSYWFALINILRCSIYLRSFLKPTPFPNSTNTPSIAHYSAALCLPIRRFCHFILPVDISHKYSDDLMKGYHCTKLIESKLMFHLGIAHNIMNGNFFYQWIFWIIWQCNYSTIFFKFLQNSYQWGWLAVTEALVYFQSRKLFQHFLPKRFWECPLWRVPRHSA